MKFYLVEASRSQDEYIVLGIFSSREKAESMVRKYTTYREWLEITEIESDKETKEFLRYIGYPS